MMPFMREDCMIERWVSRLVSRIKTFFKQAKIFRIKTNLMASVGIYFICILLTQLGYGVINMEVARQSSDSGDVGAVSNLVNQAALNINLELERIEEMSTMIYDESCFYFKQKDSYSEYKSDESELNTIIDMIFKINSDISGVSIYRPKGGMISYTNPYGSYYYVSGTKSQYSELIAYKDKGSMLERSHGDNLGQCMISINFYQPDDSKEEYAIIVLEKNWAEQKTYYEDLGLLSNGSVALINEEGQILMSFRKEDAIGDETLVRSGKLSSQFTGASGMFETEAYGETKYIFYDKNVGSGCTLIYISGGQFFGDDMQGMYYVILASSLILILVNALIIIIFVRNVYRPIMNVEGALHAIVSGETNLKLKKVPQGNELYPVYNDINSLITRLKQLIDSEYTASIMKKQAEIDALQSQINPHFLYNTLESIRGQAIVEEVEGIEKMVKALADIFRYSITNKNAMVRIEEELKNIDSYLDIQQFRFDNKFIVVKEIEEDTKNCLIPKLVIQPLVENAIIHGLETKPGKGMIKISSVSTTDSIAITVEDNGEGMDSETLEAINECLARGVSLKNAKDIKVGLGLININERIKLIFDSSYGLKIYSIKQLGTKVELRIPKTSK
jgi:sensor histidine kinase YesM